LEEAVASGILKLTLTLLFVQQSTTVDLGLTYDSIIRIKTPAKSLFEALDGIRVQFDRSI
jgi:hypothetical protein